MVSLPLKASNPQLMCSSILFYEMVSEPSDSFAVVERAPIVQHGHLESVADTDMRTSPSVSPNQALGKSTSKAARSSRATKRKPTSHVLKLSVLVVDDVADVTEMISLFLRHAGYDVTTADSAVTALQLANEKTFNLIISDIGMPEMNGYEFAESLRRRAEYQGTPMIAVTGYSEYDDRTRALKSGFNSHLTKPIDPTELLNLMSDLLLN